MEPLSNNFGTRLTEPAAAASCCWVMAIFREARDWARPSPGGAGSGLALPLRVCEPLAAAAAASEWWVAGLLAPLSAVGEAERAAPARCCCTACACCCCCWCCSSSAAACCSKEASAAGESGAP